MNLLHRIFGAKEDSTAAISSEKVFHEKLKIERSRTHRNGHEFSLVVFDLGGLPVDTIKQNKVVQTISGRIRGIDYIGWYNQNKLGVILPYTSAKGAKEFSKNIIFSIDNVRKEAKYTVVTYPPEHKSSGPILTSMQMLSNKTGSHS